MHVLLEGVIPYNLKAMLKSYVSVKRYISIEIINQRMSSFKFSWSESKSKPCSLSSNMLRDEGHIHQQVATYINHILEYAATGKMPVLIHIMNVSHVFV